MIEFFLGFVGGASFSPAMPPREPEQSKPAQPEAFGMVAIYLKGSSGNYWANYLEGREMRIATMLEW